MKTFIVSFQYVSAQKHPEHYCAGHGSHPVRHHPARAASEVPGRDWTDVVVRHTNHADAMAQFHGLNDLMQRGELIRAVLASTHQNHDDHEEPEPGQRVDHREHASYQ